MWLFYLPIGLWIALLSLRFKGLTFTAVNPGLPVSGLYGEQKSRLLSQLKDKQNPMLARFVCLPIKLSFADRCHLAAEFMQQHQLQLPVVLKPETGQRGSHVVIVKTQEQLQAVLQAQIEDCLLQEYIEGLEFGVFYIKNYSSVNHHSGYIYSLTQKCFPTVVGDDQTTLRELILKHPRGHLSARLFFQQHYHQLDRVLADKQSMKLVELGTHSRGSLFVDSMHNHTSALQQAVEKIVDDLDGFYFGRMDIRVPDLQQLHQGQGIKVLEINGVTSEATHIYDPHYSVFYAYRVMFKQWLQAFELGKSNIQQHNATALSLKQFIQYVKQRS